MEDRRKRIIRMLERIHLGHWLTERLIKVVEYINHSDAIMASLAAWASGVSARLLAAPWWIDVLIGGVVWVGILFYRIPRKSNPTAEAPPVTPPSASLSTTRKTYWDPPSYVGVEHVGRRIESAIYAGLAGTADVKTRIEALSENQSLPVNHFELCGGDDPSWGDKFLTITYSETLKQGDVLLSPRKWLRGTGNINTETAPRMLIDYASDGIKNFLTLKNDHVSETLYRWNLRPIRCVFTKNLSSVYGNPAIQGKHEIVQEFLFEENVPLIDYLRQKTPTNSEVTAEMYFENDKGAGFLQPFTLVTYPDGSLKWQPGTVRPQV